jgi:alpha/beta hydrolase fold
VAISPPGSSHSSSRKRSEPRSRRFASRAKTRNEERHLSTTVPDQAIPEGPGSVSGAPNLPKGFTDTFTSRYIDGAGLRQHAVVGGKGPPLLLVHGWPQTWYQYRLVMPALARDFEVIAVDQRGMGPARLITSA